MSADPVSVAIVDQTVVVAPELLVVQVLGQVPAVVSIWYQANVTLERQEQAAVTLVSEPVVGEVTVHQPAVLVDGVPGPRGPAGPQGEPGPPAEMPLLVAARALGGHRAVVAVGDDRVDYASADQPDHAGRVLGITAGAVDAAEAVRVVIAGPMVEPSWNWVSGPVFVGLDGLLTQAPPASGFVQVVGAALAPTRLLVALGDPIILN